MRAGQLATLAKVNILHPVTIDLCGYAGFSGVWLCNEHGPNDWTQLDACIRTAKLHDMDIIVRVSKGSYSDYIKPFEADASAIMVPHITSAEEARWIVEHTRCQPLGNRPIDGGNADGRYCQHQPEEYIRFVNEEKMIMLQIESPEGVESVDEIAAVPGFDCLVFGPGDFSHRTGVFGNLNDPRGIEARRKVEEACKKHGKFGCAVALNVSEEELKERGYGCVHIASDVIGLAGAFRDSLEQFRKRGRVDSYYEKS